MRSQTATVNGSLEEEGGWECFARISWLRKELVCLWQEQRVEARLEKMMIGG
jgi:hypothetical protein